MKKILFILLSLASFAGYAQTSTFGGIGLRVNDTTTYQANAAALHTAGYYDIYFNNQATNDHWDVWNGSSYDHIFSFGSGGGPSVLGAQDLFISAAAMWPRGSNGCSILTPVEMTTSLLTVQSLDFDQTADEYAQLTFSLPRNWDNGTITATVYWTAPTGTGTVEWEVNAVAYSNDDPLTGTFGTAVEIDDTLIAVNDLHITPTSSAITIAGTPADGDMVALQIMRDVSDDTLSADAKLLGIRLTITLDAATSE